MTKRVHNIFFTSDWHIGHHNVIKYDNRPFKDIHEMADKLVENYNSMVRPQDICYFLGDFFMCKTDYAKAIVKQLNGTKIFILGNHDKAHDSMTKLGFDAVLNSASLWIQNEMVTMAHFPLREVHNEKARPKFSVPDNGQFHLHGHTHSIKKFDGRNIEVGVRAWDYKPVPISEIESYITKYRRTNV